jgi:hypothetical protein
MRILFIAALVLYASIAAAQTIDKSGGISSSPNVLNGYWIGNWDSQRNNGQMEMEARTVDDWVMSGRVRATFSNPVNCSTGWETLTGGKKGETLFARYDLKGRCGEVDLTFSIEGGNVMTGTWLNEYGGNGTFRLTKQ